MNILCLNTAFSQANIALQFNGRNYFKTLDCNCKHSENLLVEIEKLFADAESKSTNDVLKEIDVIAVVIGPGSFTGLRISTATAKALLVTHPHIKCVPINSLELIANEYGEHSNNITAVIDALSGFYFISEFDSNLNCITKPKMITYDELQTYPNLITCEQLRNIDSKNISLTPENLLKTTLNKINNKEFILENDLVPLYIRPSQAEANFKNGNKN